jgi:cobalamin biosynthesis protein CobW
VNDPDAKIPALVVSGFLGSGKTSLVRHLLERAQAEDMRIAVVSNELGALGIDRALLGAGGEAFVELEGGCVCCELADDLLETLELLHDRVRPDRIVIETSGVALPFDTQLNFWREPVAQWIGDDMALVVVNAEQLLEGRDLEGTFSDQVSSADLLVLNKIDLVAQDQLEAILRKLRGIEPEAPIVRAQNGRIDTALLFPPELRGRRSGPAPQSPPHLHEAFESFELRIEAGIAESELRERLTRQELLRAKGFVRTADGLRLVQVVGRRIEIEPVANTPDPELVGRLVLISRASLA